MSTPSRGTGEKGLAVILTGLLLIPLMTFAAFGVDLASWYSRISYLQKAADAASLAGTVWMPDLGKATIEARASLRENGIVHGTDGMQVDIRQGATVTALRVTVTDTDADRVFSQVFRGQQSLTRFAEAEYNLPIPLGSPLNYFGGDATRTIPPTPPTPPDTYSVAWPADYATRGPANRSPNGCNVGTSSGQNLGSWPSSGGFTSGGHDGSDPQCEWTVTGSAVSGASASPPPDYTTRPPTNSGGTGCRVRTNGNADPFLGRWSGTTFTATGANSGTVCSWTNFLTTAASIPSFATVQTPTNRPCRVGYEAAGLGGGWWPSSGGYDATANTPPVGGSSASGNRLCQWRPAINTIVSPPPPTPPNPINAGRSPGFWAAVEGPQTRAYQGDAYDTRCYPNADCTSDQNLMYRQPGNADRGFWYVVKIPTGLSGNVALNVFDASYVPVNTTTLAGDRSLDGGGAFPTQFQVWQQTNPLDFAQRTAKFSGAPNTTDGSCNWTVGNDSSFNGQWRNLCNLSVSPGQIYLINVQTTGYSGAGVNGYALEAVAGGTHLSSPQPALYAYASMAMQNNNFCTSPCTPPPATFYLAEVGPQYAGRTLVMELWDSGDVSGSATMYPMMPATTSTNPSNPNLPRPVIPVPTAQCSFTADAKPNTRISGVTGTEYLTEQPSDIGTQCGIRTSTGSGARFNGEWLRIRIDIPATYTCVLGRNPETTGNSCWWGIRYEFGASANDVTTWQARIEGNPVRLTQ